MAKTYTIISTRRNTESTTTGTLEALIEAFGYTLECGASYQNEKGNKKINKVGEGGKVMGATIIITQLEEGGKDSMVRVGRIGV